MSARGTRAPGERRRPARYTEVVAAEGLAAAIGAHRRGDLDGAIAGYRGALERCPGCLDAAVNLATVLVRAGRVADARVALEAAEALSHDHPRALRDLALARVTLGDFAQARSLFARAHALAPGHVGVLLAWSRACGEDGSAPEAHAHAIEASERAPGDASTWVERHRAALGVGALDDAVASIDRAATLDGGARVRSLAAALRIVTGEAEAARAMAEALPEGWGSAIRWASAWPEAAVPAARCEGIRWALAQAPGEGLVMELGVRLGVSARVLAASTSRTVHGFDSFDGLPSAWRGVPAGTFSMRGLAPPLPRGVTLHQGLFEETLGDFIATTREAPAFVHIDSDLYESARTVLTSLGPLLPRGAVLLFDEYLGDDRWREGEHRALCEAVERFEWRIEVLAWSLCTGQVALRV